MKTPFILLKSGAGVLLIGLTGLFLMTSCRSDRQWAEIFLRKGNEYQAKGQYDLALVEYQKAHRIEREYVPAHLGAADIYLKTGNCPVAIEEINYSGSLDHGIPARYYFEKAKCLLKRNPPDLAPALEEGILLAIKNDPNNADYYRLAGDLQEKLGEKELALQFHQKAQALAK